MVVVLPKLRLCPPAAKASALLPVSGFSASKASALLPVFV